MVAISYQWLPCYEKIFLRFKHVEYMYAYVIACTTCFSIGINVTLD